MFLFSCSPAILLFSFLFLHFLFFLLFFSSICFHVLSLSFSFSLFTTHVSLLYLSFFPSFISLFCSKNSTCYACMLLQWLSKAMIFRIIHCLFSFHFNLPKLTFFFFFFMSSFSPVPQDIASWFFLLPPSEQVTQWTSDSVFTYRMQGLFTS